MWEWPKTTASASGKRRRKPLERPVGGPGVVHHGDPRAVGLDDALAPAAPPESALVDVPVHAATGGPRRSSSSKRPSAMKSPAWRIRSACAGARRTRRAVAATRAAGGCRR